MAERILVTGGAGFLGSHVCERFLNEGAEVVCLDNLITGSAGNVGHLTERSGFSLVEHDMTRPYFPDPKPTAVLHLASPASPPAYLANPIHTLKVGSLGTMHALGMAREAEATFLLASTSEVYGDPEVRPQPESYRGNVSTTGPRGVYDEAKRFAEAMTMAYHRAHGVDTRIVRIFNTYGPRLAPGDGRAVPNFISQALDDRPLTVYGDGSQTRSFCYVDDLVDGIVALLRSGEHEPVNIGNPDERSILDLAEAVISLTGASSEIVFEPLPEDDPKIRCPDIARARALLGWAPRVSLEEGLERTVAWFRSALPAAQ
jgi:dTDP-glucose 4,6-dehydratase